MWTLRGGPGEDRPGGYSCGTAWGGGGPGDDVPQTFQETFPSCLQLYGQAIGMIPDVPYPEARWTRYFKSDNEAPCLICAEVKSKRTMCSLRRD